MSRYFISNMISAVGSVCKPLASLLISSIMQNYKKSVIPTTGMSGNRKTITKSTYIVFTQSLRIAKITILYGL
jgi:hypothetical protein